MYHLLKLSVLGIFCVSICFNQKAFCYDAYEDADSEILISAIHIETEELRRKLDQKRIEILGEDLCCDDRAENLDDEKRSQLKKIRKFKKYVNKIEKKIDKKIKKVQKKITDK